MSTQGLAKSSIPDMDKAMKPENERQTYMEWTRQKGSDAYQGTWRWIEDTYLKYFGENRMSYGVKDQLKQTQVTGNKDIDGVQSNVNETVGNTFGENGLAGSVGGVVDKGLLRGNV